MPQQVQPNFQIPFLMSFPLVSYTFDKVCLTSISFYSMPLRGTFNSVLD